MTTRARTPKTADPKPLTATPGLALFPHLNHPDVGSGHRYIMVLRVAPKTITLYDFSTLTAFTVTPGEWDLLTEGEKAYPLNTTRLLERLSATRATYDKHSMRYNHKNADEARTVILSLRPSKRDPLEPLYDTRNPHTATIRPRNRVAKDRRARAA